MTAAKKLNDVFTGLKHGNWYLVEGDKHFVGQYTKDGFFLVVGERMSKYLTSAGLILIPCSSRENSAIWSQFALKLQNLKSCFCVRGTVD